MGMCFVFLFCLFGGFACSGVLVWFTGLAVCGLLLDCGCLFGVCGCFDYF